VEKWQEKLSTNMCDSCQRGKSSSDNQNVIQSYAQNVDL